MQQLYLGTEPCTLFMLGQMAEGLIPGTPGPATMSTYVSRAVLAWNIMESFLEEQDKKDQWLQALRMGG